MRDLRELNINEGGRPVVRTPPTDAQVAGFEAHFGVELPSDLVDLIRHSDGGHPTVDAFQPHGLIEEELWGINRFCYLNDDQQSLSGIWGATRDWGEATSRNVVAVAEDGCGNAILLLFDHNPPTVELCVHYENYKLFHVADSFGEFIDGLIRHPDAI